MDYTTPIDELKLRYVIVHSASNLKRKLKENFGRIASASYDIDDITSNFQIDVISKSQDLGEKLSITEIFVFGMPYESIKEFEDTLVDENGVLEVCKTFDSFKMEENQELLKELFTMEMKIREIYTVLARLQNVNLENSRVRLLKEFHDNKEIFERRLMNEFFFINFSDYKNVDKRKDTKLENLLVELKQVRRIRDISSVVTELTSLTLHLDERFNELSRIPEAIGRMENLRNVIAHNKYVSDNDLENFGRARDIIDRVYDAFFAKFRKEEI